MVKKVVWADSATKRLPPSVRARLAVELADDSTEIGAAVAAELQPIETDIDDLETAVAGKEQLGLSRATVARMALAAGRRVRAKVAGDQAEAAVGVTVSAMKPAVDTGTTGASLGSATLSDTGDLITTSVAHGLAVGDQVVLGTITSSTGISADTVYYVKTVPSSTTFTVTGNLGGGTTGITTNGSTANLYRRTPAYDRDNSRVNSNLRILGTRAVQANVNFPRWDYIAADPTIVTYSPGALTGTGISIEVEYSGRYIDILFRRGGSSAARVYVDGRLVKTVALADFTAVSISTGSIGRLPLAFADARVRNIRVVMESPSDEFPGFDFTPGQAIRYPSTALKGPKVLMVGDSFFDGTGAGSSPDLVRWVSWFMGWPDTWRAGSGSTGYYADGTRQSLSDRYTNDIITQAPDICVIAMGINDKSAWIATPSTVTAAATTVWDAVIAGLPSTELVIVGPFPGNGGATPDADMIAFDNALHALAVARGLRYISPIGEGWTFSLSDATHPDPAGHKLLAMRLAGHLSVPYLEPV